MPDRIKGVLRLQLATNGTVAFVFMPGRGAGSSPLLAKNIEQPGKTFFAYGVSLLIRLKPPLRR
jgi:hypothetical protein